MSEESNGTLRAAAETLLNEIADGAIQRDLRVTKMIGAAKPRQGGALFLISQPMSPST
jgi:hypothetical protein